MIRVMLVDDHEMIRAGLRTIIEAHPQLTVVAEAGDGISALHVLKATEIDVILMDIRMPGIDGVETTRRIRTTHDPQDARILVLTTFDQDDYVLSALRAGADGFFSKGTGPTELAEGIINVASGGHSLSVNALNALIDHVAEDNGPPANPEAAALFEHLTPRELEIVEAIVRGLDNTEIAAELYLSPFTVKTHAHRAMTKVGANDRAKLVSLAFQAGIRPR